MLFGRDTTWRQGSWAETCPDTSRSTTNDSALIYVVITHDCDLANDAEPCVEFLEGTRIESPNGNFVRAKNARKLHLYLTESVCVEFDFSTRLVVEKAALEAAQFALHGPCEREAKRVLKQWLAARYGRPAFPNAFEKRMDKVRGKLENILSKPELSGGILGVFISLDEPAAELPEGTPYALTMAIVYDDTLAGGDEPLKGARVAIEGVFQKTFGSPSDATEVALDACSLVHETKMSLRELRSYDQWRLEHVSFKQGGPFLGPDKAP